MTSVYIHIPFCQRICSYCDFPKRVSKSIEIDHYLDTLEKEIKMYQVNDIIDTLYIGGGTPSILSSKQLLRLNQIIKLFHLSNKVEFTMECNPEHITNEKIILLKQLGVNRISLGVQTFNERLLRILNRGHLKNMVYDAVNLLKKNNLSNISMDLIFAIPFQTIEEVKEDLAHIQQLDVPHISYYSLILEEKTVFDKLLSENKIQLIDNETEAQMYELILNSLKKSKYHHYEISNYAKKGYESRHNQVYWQNKSYYGFGMGASGYVNHVRYYNVNYVNQYIELIKKEKRPIKHQDTIDKSEELKEAFLLGLRLIDGLSIEEINKRYQVNILEYFEREFKCLVDKGFIEISDRIKLTHTGLFYGNEVFEVFV
ncbi:oxygen-independent coproporphyrinogen III oxidase [Mycoplasmatota bacterium]|nr:oxygen-independent coproporphyrinogen III oxidase [Mycoplasmatota bacterium]